MDNQGAPAPGRRELDAAAERVRDLTHRTPVMTSSSLDGCLGAEVFFKCENLQRIGAFKIRGAVNALASLSAGERARGFVTHSSGNHAQALALAARLFEVPATVVMPRNAPAVKKAAVKGYGARIVDCEPTFRAREDTAAALLRETGAHFVSPFDDARIIAGASTATRELIEEVPDLDLLLMPVGGGGLASGAALVVSELLPSAKVIGCEPSGADDAARSIAAG
ncbi:MAG: pyridoxal-phosphate dependent enzyme, partial [Acidobacteriota bacterium]